MKLKGVIATTHTDRHNMRMSKEALDSAVDQIKGNFAPLVGLEHDVTLPPLGKVMDAYVEPTEDGEFQLVAVSEVFEESKEIVLPDGSLAWIQESKNDRRPFKGVDTGAPNKLEISIDPVNFQTKEDSEKFVSELRVFGEFKSSTHLRKALISDPQLIITFTNSIITYLIGQKVIEKVGDKILEPVLADVGKIYPLIKNAITGIIRYAIPKNRPVTYIFVAPGLPTIEFVARTNNPDVVISAILQQKLEEPFSKAQELYRSLQAVKVQFLLDSDDHWNFNYLLTDKGAVIGSTESHFKRARILELMAKEDGNGLN